MDDPGCRIEDALPYRQVAEHLPTPCWISDAQGDVVWVNTAWRDYTGMSVEDIAREGLARLHDPDILPVLQRRWDETRAAGEAAEMVFPMRGRNGEFRAFRACTAPIRDARGEITHWFGVNTDITPQTEAEARLRLGEEQLRELFEIAADGIFVCDEDGRLVNVNPAVCEIAGRSREELIGMSLRDLIDPRDLLRVAEARPAPAAREEWRLIRPGGDSVLVEVSTQALSDGRRLGIARDITTRARVEHERQLAEAGRYRLLVDAITDYAVYMLDANGIISSWNPGAERFKGYVAAEVLGQHFSRFYTDEDRASGLPDRALATAAREGRFEGEGWRVRKDGTQFWAQVTVDPIRASDGRVIGYAKITRDLTERRQAQRALEEAREALFQSQKMEAIGQLTGGIAHDFNNLLMAILGSLDLVRKRVQPDPRVTPLLENAIQGAERGAALTQRMLAFARKQELKLEPVAVEGLVLGMLGLLERSLGPGVLLRTDFARDLPPVLTDGNQLENAILNLCVNARDAMPNGGTITIGAERSLGASAQDLKLPPGEFIRLSVSDIGEGMDAETVARATDPFFTTKGVGKGTGLGLSMVQGLAEQSGGRLRLRTALGEGTTVEMWLPVAVHDDLAAEDDQRPEAPVAEVVAPLSILVVDDDNLVLLNSSAQLEDLGHHVIEASSAKQALEVLAGARVDLVITDEAMPTTTGAQLIVAIKSRFPGLPVILASGYAEAPEGVGPDIVRLAKPFGQRDLSAAIAAAVQGAPELIR